MQAFLTPKRAAIALFALASAIAQLALALLILHPATKAVMFASTWNQALGIAASFSLALPFLLGARRLPGWDQRFLA